MKPNLKILNLVYQGPRWIQIIEKKEFKHKILSSLKKIENRKRNKQATEVFGPITSKAGALTRHDGATTRRTTGGQPAQGSSWREGSHAGQRQMRRGIGRRDYSNKLKTARSRSGIPDHSCPPPSPPPPLLTHPSPPPPPPFIPPKTG